MAVRVWQERGTLRLPLIIDCLKRSRMLPTAWKILWTTSKNCINAIYEKTSELGYTIDKMATSGYSAGGHLALLYAYSRPDAAAIPVKLVFEEVGPADFDAGRFCAGDFPESAYC